MCGLSRKEVVCCEKDDRSREKSRKDGAGVEEQRNLDGQRGKKGKELSKGMWKRRLTEWDRRMREAIFTIFLIGLPWIGGCIRVKTDPIRVEPIHITMDVNVRISRELENFFGDLDAMSETMETTEMEKNGSQSAQDTSSATQSVLPQSPGGKEDKE